MTTHIRRCSLATDNRHQHASANTSMRSARSLATFIASSIVFCCFLLCSQHASVYTLAAAAAAASAAAPSTAARRYCSPLSAHTHLVIDQATSPARPVRTTLGFLRSTRLVSTATASDVVVSTWAQEASTERCSRVSSSQTSSSESESADEMASLASTAINFGFKELERSLSEVLDNPPEVGCAARAPPMQPKSHRVLMLYARI
jgi:hypothetical protein